MQCYKKIKKKYVSETQNSVGFNSNLKCIVSLKFA